MRTAAIIQARMGSTRLPGKVLADIAGVPLIRRIIDRVRACKSVDLIVVATTSEPEDDALEAFVRSVPECGCFRGSVDDVLDRYFRCAEPLAADLIVRVTADDPLKDPEIIDRAIQMLRDDPTLDYCSNTLTPTFPEGLDIEALRFTALRRAWKEARLPSEREHVTPYIWKNPDRFSVRNFTFERNLSAWRWTVDKPADLELMRAVFGHFKHEPLVGFRAVIDWLEENPAIREINTGTLRNEGYLKSIASESSNERQ